MIYILSIIYRAATFQPHSHKKVKQLNGFPPRVSAGETPGRSNSKEQGREEASMCELPFTLHREIRQAKSSSNFNESSPLKLKHFTCV